MNRKHLNFLSLFAGIGGIDLGLERAGMRCVAQVEIDPFCLAVLKRHWPDVPKFEDVKKITANSFADRIDCIAGGFPCQDISLCGKRAGIDGENSGLWHEFSRLICDIRPRYVFVENVAALLVPGQRGQPAPISRILSDLAACRFDAEWDCLPASAFGAYCERDRAFILAYPSRVDGQPHDLLAAGGEWSASLQSRRFSGMAMASRGKQENSRLGCEPLMARMVQRVPGASYRLKSLGNSVYPAVAEWIGHRIMEDFK